MATVPCSMLQLRLRDGYQAAARLWRPDAPRGAVLYLHGIQSHGGWYETSGGCLAAQEPSRVASLSLVAPGLFPRVDLSPAEKFRVAMSLINHPDQMFDIPLNDPRLFTANPARIRQIEEDPLMLRQVSASFLLATRRMDRVVQRFVRSPWRGPVHLLLAGQDPIIHNDRTRAWLRELRSEDLRITEYPAGHHTLEFETNPEPFLEDLVSWIAEQSGRAPLAIDSSAR